MQQQLINHSPDLKRLFDEGYSIEIDKSGGHVLVHHIPYLDSNLKVQYGTLVSTLTLATPTRAGKPSDHTVYFCGDVPYNASGFKLDAIINNSQTQRLNQYVTVNHYFSSKPMCGYYVDYYEKFRTYAEILLTQARIVDKSVTTKPNKTTRNGSKYI